MSGSVQFGEHQLAWSEETMGPAIMEQPTFSKTLRGSGFGIFKTRDNTKLPSKKRLLACAHDQGMGNDGPTRRLE